MGIKQELAYKMHILNGGHTDRLTSVILTCITIKQNQSHFTNAETKNQSDQKAHQGHNEMMASLCQADTSQSHFRRGNPNCENNLPFTTLACEQACGTFS